MPDAEHSVLVVKHTVSYRYDQIYTAGIVNSTYCHVVV